MVLKEQIRVISLSEGEVRYLEKSILFGGDVARMDSWDNGSVVPEDALKNAQIQAISRRLVGMTRSITKFPTYRRRFRQVVKALISYSLEKEGSSKTHSTLSRASIEIVSEV
ncbi:putative membrane protein [Acorus calamus]|uniref:Membrane protein n=1 Tax=Acorus calamus TaxID=4465 RepID=A0AAV9ENG8_ACOCL|nr:putative membrane protein [Acorus calamus]